MSNQKIKTGKITVIRQTKDLPHVSICPSCPSTFDKFAHIDFSNRSEFDYNEDNFFFYIAEKHSKNDLLYREKGLAKQKNDRIERIYPLSSSKLYNFTTKGDELAILYTYVPVNYAELLVLPNSLITSNDDSIQITSMPEYSLLGRLGESIEALEINELGDLIGRVQPKQLTLAPLDHRPLSPTTGTIIFNNETGNFEGFNGNKWIALGK